VTSHCLDDEGTSGIGWIFGHGKPVELKLQDLWIKDIAITMGLVSATTTPMLLRLVAQGKLTPEKFVSHRFTFEAIIDAYDTFGNVAAPS
jgi:alcohol dehydrogenase